MQKVLWVVDYASLNQFYHTALGIGATRVAIRTTNDVAEAIDRFKGSGIEVYAWRYPQPNSESVTKHSDQAVHLLQNGLDGYYADIEGETGNNWNVSGLAELAKEFCQPIKAQGKPFGVTSYFNIKDNAPHIAWSVLFEHADVLLPQSYWRTNEGTVAGGDPTKNYHDGLKQWAEMGGASTKIFPMAGEIAHATAAEIAAYGAVAKASGKGELHFYTAETTVPESVWDAIRHL